MTPEQEERLVVAFESMAETFDFIAGTLDGIGKTLYRHHRKTFPKRKKPADATITHILTPEEQLRADQGESDEPIDEWTTLGPREAAYIKAHPDEKEKFPTGPGIEDDEETKD
jgi:hypothetical protein